jgi:hypothetical protein
MAFNPFASFRKYQKYWMAGAVLVCMVTFVLCSGGIRGTGLDDLLMWITRRKGDEYARINNRRYNYEDLQELKNQRNLANDYMRELTKVAHDRMVNIVKQINAKKMTQKLEDKEQQELYLYGRAMRDLADKYAEQRFFMGGAKLDDLVDFVLWRDLADKYGVNLTDDMVRDLVTQSVHAYYWGGLDANTAGELVYKMRMQHSNATDSNIFAALRDEFRVQILQLAYLGHWPTGEGFRLGDNMTNEREMMIRNRIFPNVPLQYRIMPTPEQISAQYRKTRTELTIDLLPVSLEELAKAEKLPEDPAKRLEVLKQFYEQYAKEPYNPTSEKPGFKMPQRVEVQYITADAGMEYYKKPAETLTILEKHPPAIPNVLGPLGGKIGWLAALPAFQTALEQGVAGEKMIYMKKIEDHFMQLQLLNAEINRKTDKAEEGLALSRKEDLKKRYAALLENPYPQYKYGVSSLLTDYYWNDEKLKENEAKPSAAAVAAFTGALGGTDGFLSALSLKRAHAYVDQLKDLEPMLAQDLGKRAKAGSEIILAASPDLTGTGVFTAAALTYHQGQQPQFLPIAGFYEKELTQTIEKDRALKAMQAVMLDTKKRLEEVSGRGEAFKDKLSALKNQYSRTVTDKDGSTRTVSGFEFHETGRLHSEYDIDDDPVMQPLVTSYNKNRTFINMIEGRAGKPQLLRDSDFPKLFFGGEVYGLAKEETNNYIPKIWPPNVSTPKGRLEDPLQADTSKEIRLFDKSDKPFIFWTSRKVPANTEPWNPNKLRLVEFTEQQYKMDKARSRLMQKVQEVATVIRDARRAERKDPQAEMAKEAEKLGTRVVVLKNVAELVENKDTASQQTLHFIDYTLPPKSITFARPDTVKDLLKLHGLSAALQFPDDNDKELNELNKKLFEPKLGGKLGQVQVISNKPRNIYYIAMVTDVNEPEMFHYFADVLPQATLTGTARNTFVDQVQGEYGKQLLKATLEQLRAQGEVNISKQARDQFASSDQGSQ